MQEIMNNHDYDALLQNIGNELNHGRQHVVSVVNAAIVETYWRIGQHLVEYEQGGNEIAEYGSKL